MRGLRSGVGFGALWLAMASAGAAQVGVTTPAPTREEINREPPSPAPQPGTRLSVTGGEIERAPCPLAEDQFKSVTVTISQVLFSSLKGVSPDILKPAYEAYVGKTEPIAVVCEIRDAAATILRREGYLAAVQVPPQRIENGVVYLNVLMAKLVRVQVRGDAGKSEQLIAATLNRLTGDEAFNQKKAERYLLLARDIPGLDVRLTLKPAGTVPGEVVGEVTVVRTPFTVDFNVQNYGSREVGRVGGQIRAEAYDLVGAGDRLTLGYFATSDFREQNVVQAGYDVRLGSEGATLGGRFTYAWTKPEISGVAGSGQFRSRTLIATLEGAYPLIRRQDANLRAALGFDLINQRVRLADIEISRDKLRVLYGRVDFDAIDRASIGDDHGYTAAEPRWRASGSLELRKGLGIFDASNDCGPAPYTVCLPVNATRPSRIEGRPQAALVRFQGVFEARPTPLVTISLSPRAQYTSRPLLSYEEFSGGNFTIGRGYDPGTIIGDRGVGYSVELRYGSPYPKTPTSAAFQPYVFLDAAWVWNLRELVAPPGGDPQRLVSVGGGLRTTFGDRARLDMTLAVPLRRAGFQADRGDVRFLFSLTTKLWPWRR